MNFVAHVVVASQAAAQPSTALLLGAAAPDLARMAGVRVADVGSDAHLDGVALHHRTDAAFHEHDWFRTSNRSVVRMLVDRGVRRGPARGAGHVLVELLLDGALLDDRQHAAAFAPAWTALAEPDDDAVAMVPAEHRDGWRLFLDQLTRRLDPAAYGDPAYAADRTVGTLSRRPRLAMDERDAQTRRDVAADVQQDVRAAAPSIMKDVVDRVQPPGSRRFWHPILTPGGRNQGPEREDPG